MIHKPNLFRKKALDRISAPDQLTDYLRVPQPLMWLLLAAILVLLLGLMIWSFAGTVDISEPGTAVIADGQAEIMLSDPAACRLKPGMTVRMNGENSTITRVMDNMFGQPVGYAHTAAADGSYDVDVIVRSAHPAAMLFGG